MQKGRSVNINSMYIWGLFYVTVASSNPVVRIVFYHALICVFSFSTVIPFLHVHLTLPSSLPPPSLSLSPASLQYMFLFQIPWLPELLLSARDYRAIATSFVGKRNVSSNQVQLTFCLLCTLLSQAHRPLASNVSDCLPSQLAYLKYVACHSHTVPDP